MAAHWSPVCRALREELEAEGVQRPKALVAVRPTDSLASVVRTLFDRGCSMAPVLCADSRGVLHPRAVRRDAYASRAPFLLNQLVPLCAGTSGGSTSAVSMLPPSPTTVTPPSPGSAAAALAESLDGDVLHTATISGVLACLMRHFRASLASLPLLAQPLSALPIGTWAPTSSLAAGIASEQGDEQVGKLQGVFQMLELG